MPTHVLGATDRRLLVDPEREAVRIVADRASISWHRITRPWCRGQRGRLGQLPGIRRNRCSSRCSEAPFAAVPPLEGRARTMAAALRHSIISGVCVESVPVGYAAVCNALACAARTFAASSIPARCAWARAASAASARASSSTRTCSVTIASSFSRSISARTTRASSGMNTFGSA